VKPDRIWSVWRARCEHACERDTYVVLGMNLQDCAISFMEPRHHDQLGAGCDSLECRSEPRIDFKRRLRGSFEGLTGRVPTVTKTRPHDPNRCYVDEHRRRHVLTDPPLSTRSQNIFDVGNIIVE